MSFSDWIGLVSTVLSMTIGSLGSFTITIGGAMGFILASVGAFAALSLLMRVIFGR